MVADSILGQFKIIFYLEEIKLLKGVLIS